MPKNEDKEQLEELIVSVLTNQESDPVELEQYKILLVFKRPSLTSKYRHAGWASKKLREMGIDDEDDPQIAFLMRAWGLLNSYIVRVLVESKGGSFSKAGKKYAEYAYDKDVDGDYKSPFEKYVTEEIYGKGISEEQFLISVMTKHNEWVKENTIFKDDDIKNS